MFYRSLVTCNFIQNIIQKKTDKTDFYFGQRITKDDKTKQCIQNIQAPNTYVWNNIRHNLGSYAFTATLVPWTSVRCCILLCAPNTVSITDYYPSAGLKSLNIWDAHVRPRHWKKLTKTHICVVGSEHVKQIFIL